MSQSPHIKVRRWLLAAILATVSAAAVPATAQYTDISYNTNNFPDPVLYAWLGNYLNNKYPTAWNTQGTDFDPSKLEFFLWDLLNDAQAQPQITDLRCLRWFPLQKAITTSGDTIEIYNFNSGHFPSLKYLDISGTKFMQYVDANNPRRDGTNYFLEFVRINNCKKLFKIEIGWLGRTDIFDVSQLPDLKYTLMHFTEISHPTSTTTNYCYSPRFRYLNFSASEGMYTQDLTYNPRTVDFGTYPQLAILEIPKVDNSGMPPVVSFTLTNSMISDLSTQTFLEAANTLDLSNNRLVNLSLTGPTVQSQWDISGNNLSHIEIGKGNTGTITPTQFASQYHPGMATTLSTNGWGQYGKLSNFSNCQLDANLQEIQWTAGGNSPSYAYTTDVGSVDINVTVAPQETIPLLVELTSEYELDAATKTIVMRKTPVTYVLKHDPNKPNTYISDNIEELTGPYTITATKLSTQGKDPTDEDKVYVLKGSPKDATYNDEPETSANPFNRGSNGVLKADWWPVVMTNHKPKDGYYRLQSATYFISKNTPLPPTIGTIHGILRQGQAIPATRADLDLTTFNTWTGKGFSLINAVMTVEYIAGDPLGRLMVQAEKTASIEDLPLVDEEQRPESTAWDGWYDLQGRRLRERPTLRGIYIRVEDGKATKLRL